MDSSVYPSGRDLFLERRRCRIIESTGPRGRYGDRFRLPAMLSSKQVLLFALIIDLLPAPLFAQRPRMNYKTAPVMVPTTPDDRIVVDKGNSSRGAGENKMCSIQPFPGMANSVSVTSLQIPSKAQKEYEEACAALKNKKLPEAEQHLHKAIKIYPKYVAGWVMLGQILETRQQTAGARDACSRASGADPSYLPAYLCLAEIAGREQEWNEVLNLTRRALELDQVNDAYGYFFSAIAYFNLNQLPEAENNALKAEGSTGITTNHCCSSYWLRFTKQSTTPLMPLLTFGNI
jgi:tetratricopeptide (TPR) repeat protein